MTAARPKVLVAIKPEEHKNFVSSMNKLSVAAGLEKFAEPESSEIDPGLCVAETAMWMQSALADKEHEFYQSMSEIAGRQSENKDIKLTSSETSRTSATFVKVTQLLKTAEEKDVKANNFVKVAQLFFQPEKFKDEFNGEILDQGSDVTKISDVVARKYMPELSPMVTALEMPRAYTAKEMQKFLDDVRSRVKKQFNKSDSPEPLFAIQFNNKYHTAGVFFDPRKDCWVMHDSSDGSRKEFKPNEIGEKILSDGFGNKEPLVFNARFVTTQAKLSKVNVITNKLEQAHPITKEMVKRKSEDGETLALTAARHNRADVIDRLIELNATAADLSVPDRIYGLTPLHQAVVSRNAAMASRLIERNVDLNAQSKNNKTPLFLATEFKMTSLIPSMRMAGADVEIKGADKGWTPLHVAVSQFSSEQVHMLASTKTINGKTDKGSTPLHLATLPIPAAALKTMSPEEVKVAEKNRLKVAEMLFYFGADPTIRTPQGNSAIDLAARENNVDLLRIYLSPPSKDLRVEYKINLNERNTEGNAPLHVATRNVNLEMAQLLIQSGADPTFPDAKGVSALDMAFQNGAADLVRIYLTPRESKSQLDYKINIDAQNQEGDTQLHLAARNGNVAMVKVLTEFGANASLQNKAGETPLHVAAKTGNVEILQALLQNRKTDRNTVDNDKNTALHLFLKTNPKSGIEVLMKGGIDLSVKNKAGETLLAIAKANDRYDLIVQMLMAARVQAPIDPAEKAALQDNPQLIKAFRKYVSAQPPEFKNGEKYKETLNETNLLGKLMGVKPHFSLSSEVRAKESMDGMTVSARFLKFMKETDTVPQEEKKATLGGS
jgi:ankyrin repeat protein